MEIGAPGPTSRALFEKTGFAAAGGADSVQGTAVPI